MSDAHGVAELGLDMSIDSSDGTAGATDDDLLDVDRGLLGPVVVERKAKLAGEPGDAFDKCVAGGGDRLGVTLDLIDRLREPDMQKPFARVLERQPAPLAEPLDDALDAEVGDAREETAGTLGRRRG